MLPKWLARLASSTGVFILFSAGLPSTGSATLLYASSYGGTVTTLNLTLAAAAPGASGSSSSNASLEVLASTQDCWPQPSWLALDYRNSMLYCVGEGLTTRNGSLSSFKTGAADGSLETILQIDTIMGPVSIVQYGAGGRGLAVAHYTGSAVSTFSLPDLELLQLETWKGPLGPQRDRQFAPHPHEAALDPTGRFVLVPDLGSDLVRVFAVDQQTLNLTAVDPLVAAPGSGPRHIVFLKTPAAAAAGGEKTYMYLLGEIANTITTYEVTYVVGAGAGAGRETLAFKQVSVTGTHGDGEKVPSAATAAEIHLSPDNRFLIVSSRYERAFNLPNFDQTNSTRIPSDTLITFSLDHNTGAAKAIQVSPAGGLVPRQFSINKAGDLLAVGLQEDGRVVIIERDVQTGMLGRFLAHAEVEEGVTCVLFNE